MRLGEVRDHACGAFCGAFDEGKSSTTAPGLRWQAGGWPRSYRRVCSCWRLDSAEGRGHSDSSSQ